MILVTGPLGWLGIGLVRSLVYGLTDCDNLKDPDSSLRIRCLVLPGQDGAMLQAISDRIEITVGDLRSEQDCARFCAGAEGAVLFHTAGIIHPYRISEFYEVNVKGTINLLDAAIKSRIKRAVVVSSNSPCGCNPHPDHLFDEDSPYNPYMNYGRSKMLMELATKERSEAKRIETVLIRAPWFYGPNQPPRQKLFFKMIRDGKAPIVGDGSNLRSMSFIDNLCQGLILSAIQEKAAGKTYWVADERPYSMAEIVDTIEALLESEFKQKCVHRRLRLPNIASQTAFLIDGLFQGLGFYNQKIHVLSEMNKTIACSIAKAKKELGYEPKVALEEGMRRSIRQIFEREGEL